MVPATVILYGVCVSREARYQAYAAAGLRRIGATDRVFERRGAGSIFPAYNEMLDQAAAQPGLEALVLLHDDLEIRDDAFEDRVRAELDDDVAVMGTIGGRGPRSVQWSHARERFGFQPDAYYGQNDLGRGTFEVDLVDGCILILSPWAVRNLRFDEARFRGFHAYDADLCMQARAAGRTVKVIELDTFHHTKGGFGDVRAHRRADDAFRAKWHLPRDPLQTRLERRYPPLGRASSLGRRAGRSVSRIGRKLSRRLRRSG